MTLLVRTPTSKSMTQRALVLAALADGPCEIYDPLDCDDTRHLRRALQAFGAEFDTFDHGQRLIVKPAPLPLVARAGALDCGNAGTALRFAAAFALIADGTFTLDGDAHMRRRPLGPLTACLQVMGVEVDYLGTPGCAPVRLRRSACAPLRASVDASVSSQFASALLLVAPLLPDGLELELTGPIVSRPYLDLTLTMMRAAGCDAEWTGERALRVRAGRPRAFVATIETDWSAAAFVLAAGHITGCELVPAGLVLPRASKQGDAAIVGWLAELDRGAINEFDLTDCPDLIAPLAAVALFAKRPTRIRGAAHTRVKECDRVAVLASELKKLGAVLRVHEDGLDVAPLTEPAHCGALLDPHDDHRMAMAFGVASLRIPSLMVTNRHCVSKSFPEFWEVLDEIRAHAATR